MTLKVRLAAMMIVLLGAVMAAQYLLLQREQRVLADRLDNLTRQIDESTRLLTDRTRARLAGPFPALAALPGGGGAATLDCDSVSVIVMMRDSTSAGPSGRNQRRWTSWRGPGSVLEMEAELDRLASAAGRTGDAAGRMEGAEGRMDSALVRGASRIERIAHRTEERLFVAGEGDTLHIQDHTVFAHVPDGDSTSIRFLFVGAGGADSVRTAMLADRDRLPGALRVNVPFVSGQGGPRHVELLYSTEGITAELERARRRSYLWLAGLLGVGCSAAVLVAMQFTSPIRSLQDSFRRVQEGDLDVALRPERPDEIGKLTASFNAMVARLRESRAMEHRLAESERLAAVGTLAAGVAHEVRNPLNAMLLTLEQLQSKTAPPEGSAERERFDRYVASVTSELRRLERMVGTFLDLSRSGQLAPETVDVAESVRGSAELFADEARQRGVALETDAPGPAVIRGDPERLRTVWNNLITNALQALPGGGTVRVRVRAEGGRVTVEVADDGEGIAPEMLGKIWEPFHSGRSDGTGLGLALVRSIVERHGGTIDVTSEAGDGAAFRVELPADGGAAARGGSDAGGPGAAAGGAA